MVDGANYVALPLFKWLQSGLLPSTHDGHLDVTGSFLSQAPHYSTTYACADGGWVAVQALEPQVAAGGGHRGRHRGPPPAPAVLHQAARRARAGGRARAAASARSRRLAVDDHTAGRTFQGEEPRRVGRGKPARMRGRPWRVTAVRQVFAGTDACVAPVLTPAEVPPPPPLLPAHAPRRVTVAHRPHAIRTTPRAATLWPHRGSQGWPSRPPPPS